MNCNQVRELLPDLAAGMDHGTEDVQTHISSCSACAAKLQGFRQTMALLDEWQTPEPGPYFDTRLGARLREEMAHPVSTWSRWLHRPAWALSLSVFLIAGAVLVGNHNYLFQDEERLAIKIPTPGLPAAPGTAVGDLQALEKNNDLYADFDLLDEMQVQSQVTANF
jgi:predicted anti-sigma-YlaC factor YlaD